MDVAEAIKRRRSVREYKDKPIPTEKLERVLNAARLAPSAHNMQDWKFVVVKDKKTRGELAKAANYQFFVGEAPVVIAGVAIEPKHVLSSGIPSWIDVVIAMDHLSLVATEEGLGTCWIGAFDQAKAKEVLKIPDRYKIIELMPLGYPIQPLEIRAKDRKFLKEIVCFDEFEK
jgi:nitroreductase